MAASPAAVSVLMGLNPVVGGLSGPNASLPSQAGAAQQANGGAASQAQAPLLSFESALEEASSSFGADAPASGGFSGASQTDVSTFIDLLQSAFGSADQATGNGASQTTGQPAAGLPGQMPLTFQPLTPQDASAAANNSQNAGTGNQNQLTAQTTNSAEAALATPSLSGAVDASQIAAEVMVAGQGTPESARQVHLQQTDADADLNSDKSQQSPGASDDPTQQATLLAALLIQPQTVAQTNSGETASSDNQGMSIKTTSSPPVPPMQAFTPVGGEAPAPAPSQPDPQSGSPPSALINSNDVASSGVTVQAAASATKAPEITELAGQAGTTATPKSARPASTISTSTSAPNRDDLQSTGGDTTTLANQQNQTAPANNNVQPQTATGTASATPASSAEKSNAASASAQPEVKLGPLPADPNRSVAPTEIDTNPLASAAPQNAVSASTGKAPSALSTGKPAENKASSGDPLADATPAAQPDTGAQGQQPVSGQAVQSSELQNATAGTSAQNVTGQSAAGQTAAGTMAYPAVTSQLVAAVNRSIRDKSTHFEIRLDPADLGHVRVQLQFNDNGTASAHIVTESRETMNMLMNDRRALEETIRNSGYDPQGNLAFSFNGGNSGQQSQQNNFAQTEQSRVNTTYAGEEISSVEAAAVTQAYRVYRSGGVDITV